MIPGTKSSPPLIAGGDDVVVLVDPGDGALGVASKLEAHREGRLHRAVSVVLFDDDGRLLMQRRADDKYHSGGLWSNTACGHPRPGESVRDAAKRRLLDELGIQDCDLTPVDHFVYFAELEGGLVEHELDHVVVGRWNGTATPDPREVSETRWVEQDRLLQELAEQPGRFTAWVRSVVYRACRSQAELAVGGPDAARPLSVSRRPDGAGFPVARPRHRVDGNAPNG